MLLVVRCDAHHQAVINTDELVQVLWLKAEEEYAHRSVMMTQRREPKILTPISRVIPTTAAGATISPEKLLTTRPAD
jgi:hypothetical protein